MIIHKVQLDKPYVPDGFEDPVQPGIYWVVCPNDANCGYRKEYLTYALATTIEEALESRDILLYQTEVDDFFTILQTFRG